MVTTLLRSRSPVVYTPTQADPLQAEYYGLEGLDVASVGKRFVIADGNNGDMTPNNHVRVLTVD